ncbi:glycoside hydrolase family 104 protein [Burkholderia ubonensis]|uniref:glycoside hydrolase family 24 protein n=1 Tax=Burkholderia ubonensis TaxID=101571 RepID=UPI000A9C66B7|nr:glycoside hydrolase family 104 protein [Burkholderia ubonensis]
MSAPGPLYIIAAGTLAAAAYVWWSNDQSGVTYDASAAGDGGATDAGSGGGFLTDMVNNLNSSVQNAFTDPAGALTNTNVQAFLRMVRVGEGTAGPNGYTTLFGGGQFSDMSRHPNIAVTRGGYTSTAAGAYQILYSTWLEAKAALGLPDFSPASQDLAACWLIKRRGALADVQNGAVATAIGKCNKEWASLAGSPYGQPKLTLAQDETNFAAFGGVQTDAGTSA